MLTVRNGSHRGCQTSGAEQVSLTLCKIRIFTHPLCVAVTSSDQSLGAEFCCPAIQLQPLTTEHLGVQEGQGVRSHKTASGYCDEVRVRKGTEGYAGLRECSNSGEWYVLDGIRNLHGVPQWRALKCYCGIGYNSLSNRSPWRCLNRVNT